MTRILIHRKIKQVFFFTYRLKQMHINIERNIIRQINIVIVAIIITKNRLVSSVRRKLLSNEFEVPLIEPV